MICLTHHPQITKSFSYMNLTSEHMLFLGLGYIQLLFTAHLFSRPCLLRAEGGEGHRLSVRWVVFMSFFLGDAKWTKSRPVILGIIRNNMT